MSARRTLWHTQIGLRRYEAANTVFVNGDPAPWLAITAENNPVSIFGGFGGLGEAGTAQVYQRYLLASTAFLWSGTTVDFEYLVKDVRGVLAYRSRSSARTSFTRVGAKRNRRSYGSRCSFVSRRAAGRSSIVTRTR